MWWGEFVSYFVSHISMGRPLCTIVYTRQGRFWILSEHRCEVSYDHMKRASCIDGRLVHTGIFRCLMERSPRPTTNDRHLRWVRLYSDTIEHESPSKHDD